MRLRLGLAGALIAAILIMVAAAPPAAAQNTDLRSLLDRLDRLERDIRTLNVQLSRGGAVAPPKGAAAAPSDHALARIAVRLGALEEELRASTGGMEDLGHVVDQVSKRLDKLVADVDFRLSALEKAASAARQGAAAGPPRLSAAPSPPSVQQAPPGTAAKGFAAPPQTLGTISQASLGSATPPATQPAAKPPPAEPDVLPEGTPEDQYRFAFGLLRQARYDDAEVALRAFLKAHGSNPLAGNARYWLGETYYVRGDYQQAAVVFYEGYNTAPKGAKAADTLLKLGMSLASIDKKKEACATFDKLAREFPDAPANIAKLVTRERQRSGCK